MLYTLFKNYKKAIKSLKDNPMICKCGKKMKPYTHYTDMDKSWRFLRVICECGMFLKSDILKMPNKWNKKQGFKRLKEV